MSLITIFIADQINKREIGRYTDESLIINSELETINQKVNEILQQSSSLNLKTRYLIKISNYVIFYYVSGNNTFYLATLYCKDEDYSQYENIVYDLIWDIESQGIRSQVDKNNELSLVGKQNLTASIRKYQEKFGSRTLVLQTESQDNLNSQTPKDLDGQLPQLQDKIINVRNLEPPNYSNPNDSFGNNSIYQGNASKVRLHIMIARGIIWSTSIIMSLVSLYLILDL